MLQVPPADAHLVLAAFVLVQTVGECLGIQLAPPSNAVATRVIVGVVLCVGGGARECRVGSLSRG